MGINGTYFIKSNLGLGLGYTYGSSVSKYLLKDSVTSETNSANHSLEFSLNKFKHLHNKFYLSLMPSVSAGLGINKIKPNPTNKKSSSYDVVLGFNTGIYYFINKKWALSMTTRLINVRYSNSHSKSNISEYNDKSFDLRLSPTTWIQYLSIGLNYVISPKGSSKQEATPTSN